MKMSTMDRVLNVPHTRSLLTISHQRGILEALSFKKTMSRANHTLVPKLERVRCRSNRRFRLDNARNFGRPVILLRAGFLDPAENCLRRVGENVLASFGLNTWRRTDHRRDGTAPYMTTTEHLVVCEIYILN